MMPLSNFFAGGLMIFDDLDTFSAAVGPDVRWTYDCRRTSAIFVDFRRDGLCFSILANGADDVRKQLDEPALRQAKEVLYDYDTC